MTARARAFAQVDVFTERPALGNPVAVVLDAEGLDGAAMARLANWTNLSETTFVLPPTVAGADYRVRIFTPSRELPMAGHPTLGTCRALLDAGRIEAGPHRQEWLQECAAGLIRIRRLAGEPGAGGLSFAAPAPRLSPPPVTGSQLAQVLGGVQAGDPMVIDVGPLWLTGRVSPSELAGLELDGAAFRALLDPGGVGVNLYAVDGARCVHVRSFFAVGGEVREDPVCGSGNAAVAVHLQRSGHAGDVPSSYQARQGSHRGRDGRISVSLGEQIWVGGPAVTVVTGMITF